MVNATIVHATGRSYTAIFDEIQALRPQPRKRILAVGDSWFSLFLNEPGFLDGSNTLWHITLPVESAIINIASTGNLLHDVVSKPQRDVLKDLLDERYGYKYDAILLSGGGNDVLDRLVEFLNPNPGADARLEDCIDDAKFDAVLDQVQNDLLKFVSMRDQSKANATTPILTHTYDYITPRDLAYKFFVISRGPWAYRSMNKVGITDPALQKKITDFVLERWALRLSDLAELGADGFKLPNFDYALTLGTLTPAAATDLTPFGDWHDEIHPTPEGYRKLAQEHFNPKLQSLLA
jgi:lysophospholipase L1-like esterase